MKPNSYSPAKCFKPRLTSRDRFLACRDSIHFAFYAAPIFCVLIASRSLAAQQAATTPTLAWQAGMTQTLDAAGSSAITQSTDAISVPAAASSSSMDGRGDGSDPQQSSTQTVPNAPNPQAQSDSDRAPQTNRILGIIPNFRAISTDEKLPAQSVKEKFLTATEDSFDYSSIFIPAVLAVYSMETNATPEFGHGGIGYSRYLWHAAVDQTSENYMVEFVVPAVTHEDTRYYTLGRGGFLKRTGYALSRAVVTRSDAGKDTFNLSEVVGAGGSAGLSNLYYPARERSFGNTGKEWGIDVAIDALSFEAKEFWPDINHWLFHGAKPSPTASK
jgi:hypothetical protein